MNISSPYARITPLSPPSKVKFDLFPNKLHFYSIICNNKQTKNEWIGKLSKVGLKPWLSLGSFSECSNHKNSITFYLDKGPACFLSLIACPYSGPHWITSHHIYILITDRFWLLKGEKVCVLVSKRENMSKLFHVGFHFLTSPQDL